MIFRQITHDDLGCASYVIGDEDAGVAAVVDRPGTDQDEAVFRVITDEGWEYLHLDRRGDRWVAR